MAAEKLRVVARGDSEIVITRTFNAPRKLVFDAYTKPELVRRWLFGPEGWSFSVCDIDLRVGGTYRYVWRKESTGEEMGMGGVFQEIKPPERLVSTEKFDDPWYPGEGVGTIVLVEQNARAALAVADRAYVLVEGQNRHEGRAESLWQDADMARLYLGAREATMATQ